MTHVSQTDLAIADEVSQSVLSRAETGLFDLDQGQLTVLAKALETPVGLLTRPLPSVRVVRPLQVSLPARAVKRLNSDLALAHLRIGLLLEGASTPSPLPPFQLDDDLPEDMARRLRLDWGVNPGPIPDLVDLVEANGVVCIVRDIGDIRVHAVGSWPENQRPVVFLDLGAPDARRRAALAEELGYALLPSMTGKEASRFAGEFLMPAAEVRDELRNADLTSMVTPSRTWGVPLTVIAHHAQRIGAVNGTQGRLLRSQLREHTASVDPDRRERPTTIREAIDKNGPDRGATAARLFLTAEELRRDYLAGT